jgi:hypothetical protein
MDSLELHSRLRGQGIDRSAIDRTIDTFVAGSGLVACKPWPLGFWPLSETRIYLLSMAQRRSGAPLSLVWHNANRKEPNNFLFADYSP